MKYAIVNGKRQEAQPGLNGICQVCSNPMVAKCGNIRIHHWAHSVGNACDHWWENETEWHRNWKNKFPEDWQEIVFHAEDNEKHIADVKTDRGWVLEFQHSFLKPEERQARNAFYKKLIWIVDGRRRKRDPEQFKNALENGTPFGLKAQVRRVRSNSCTLLNEWKGSNVPVFFDFGNDRVLWWLFNRKTDGPLYIAPYSYKDFIELHCGRMAKEADEFEKFVNDMEKILANYDSYFRPKTVLPMYPRPRRQRPYYSARKVGKRRGF